MSNPLFQYIDKHFPILKNILSQKYKLNLVRKQFKKEQTEYFLLELPESESSSLKLNGMDMQVIEHHFTIPQVLPTIPSHYHYTVSLKDLKTNQQYKVRLYFDKLGRLKVEPKLFAFAEDEDLSTHSALDKEDALKIKDLFVLSSDIILFIHEQFRKSFQSQIFVIQKHELHITELSKDLSKNKNEYIKECKVQIENIKVLERMGSNEFSQQRFYFEQLLNHLVESECKSLELQAPLEEGPVEEEEILEENNNIEKDTPPKIPVRKKERKAEQIERQVKKQNQEAASLIAEIEKGEKEIGELEPHTFPISTIQGMIEKIECCDSLFKTNVSLSLKGQLLRAKSAFTLKVAQFFNEENFKKESSLYLKVVNLGICNLDMLFIEFVISTDNVELLQKLVAKDLLEDSARYRFFDDQRNFTVMEWCVYYSSIRCFQELMNHQFSLDYMDMENSPYFSLVEDLAKLDQFLTLHVKGDPQGRARIFQRICSILEIQCKEAKEPRLTMLENRIKILKQSKVNCQFLERNTYMRAVFNRAGGRAFLDAMRKSKKVDFNKIKMISENPEVQKALLECLKVMEEYMLFLKSKPRFHSAVLTSGEMPNVSAVELFASLPLEKIIEQVKFTYVQSCKKMHLYMEIIDSGLVMGFQNAKFMFRPKTNAGEVKRYIKALEELKAEEDKSTQTLTQSVMGDLKTMMFNAMMENLQALFSKSPEIGNISVEEQTSNTTQTENTQTENTTQVVSNENGIIAEKPSSTSTPMFDNQALLNKVATKFTDLMISGVGEEPETETKAKTKEEKKEKKEKKEERRKGNNRIKSVD